MSDPTNQAAKKRSKRKKKKAGAGRGEGGSEGVEEKVPKVSVCGEWGGVWGRVSESRGVVCSTGRNDCKRRRGERR